VTRAAMNYVQLLIIVLLWVTAFFRNEVRVRINESCFFSSRGVN
jgi:hypothetical protein